MKKFAIVMVIVLVLVTLLVACTPSQAAPGSASPAAASASAPAAASSTAPVAASGTQADLPGKGQVYAVIGSLFQLEFFDALKAGVSDASKEIGSTWYYAGPQDFVPDQISQAIDQAAANKVTGIILHGQSPETAAAINNAIDAGVPVICVNTDIPSKRLSFLGCNPYNAGYDMGTNMSKLLQGKKGTVLISTAISAGQPSALDNLKGAKDALAKLSPDVKVVEVDDTADANIAAAHIGAALQANSDVIGIIGQQAYTAVGAAAAIREAGLTGKVQIIGRDRDAATLELIKKGEVAASYAQNSYVEGYIALKWLNEYVGGKMNAINDYRKYGVNPLPPTVDSGSIIITKDNEAQFESKYTYQVTAKN